MFAGYLRLAERIRCRRRRCCCCSVVGVFNFMRPSLCVMANPKIQREREREIVVLKVKVRHNCHCHGPGRVGCCSTSTCSEDCTRLRGVVYRNLM